jgi:hypothetical protein
VTFELPSRQTVRLQAVIWWKEGDRIGLRFDPNDENRGVVAKYVDEQLAAAGR